MYSMTQVGSVQTCKLYLKNIIVHFVSSSGIDLKKCSFTNYSVAEKIDRKHEVCAMSWVDQDENQVLIWLIMQFLHVNSMTLYA